MRARLLLGAVLLATATTPAHAAGPVNLGFEDGIRGWSGWVAHADYDYGEGVVQVPVTSHCVVFGPICSMGPDRFLTGFYGDYGDYGGVGHHPQREHVVAPLAGAAMARLAFPFADASAIQGDTRRFRAEQSFFVDPARPVLDLAYDLWSYDFSGGDHLSIELRGGGSHGRLLAQHVQRPHGTSTAIKSSGWRPARIDLTGWGGKLVHLRVELAGSGDAMYGTWGYVDAGKAARGAVGRYRITAPVSLDRVDDPNTGMRWYLASRGSRCARGQVDVPIAPPTGSVTGARLLQQAPGHATHTWTMAKAADDTWRARGVCIGPSTLRVEYDVDSTGTVDRFVVPLGGMVVARPMGVVYDRRLATRLIARGRTPADARAAAALGNAQVWLLRRGGDGRFRPVLAADPVLHPRANPALTAANGRFRWTVEPAAYRFFVRRPGYRDVLTPTHRLPDTRFAGDVAMERRAGTPEPRPKPTLASQTGPCAGLTAVAAPRCRADMKLAADLARRPA